MKLEKPSDSPLLNGAAEVVATLKSKGFESYFVGGAPRDLLLGRQPSDIDIATAALPEQVEASFARTHRIGASFGVVTVVLHGNCYEVASFREEREYMDGRHPEKISYTLEPKLDVLRRDFTINGLLLDPETWTLFDHVGGVEDLRRGTLRTIGNPATRFSEDYLRILRAIRFCVRFNLTMDTTTKEAIPPLAPRLKALSAERIRDEFSKMLEGPKPSRAFRLMQELGILEAAFPELAKLEGVQQPEKYHPEGDVFEHTMLMLDHMATPDARLGWTILLHDIGKPSTFSVDEHGIEHFYEHECVGAGMARTILERFKMPREFTESVAEAVRNHMKFAHIPMMRPAKWRRLMASPNFPLELELHRIDCISSHSMMDIHTLLLDRVAEMQGARELPVPILKGGDLLALGMKRGPAIGKALKIIADLQLEGAISSREKALEALRRMKFIQ